MRWLWNKSQSWLIVTPILREKAIGLILASFAGIYLLFSFFEIPLWFCAWRSLTGWRCPGCGLTTGCKAFLRGHFVEGVTWNWLVPVVLLGLLVIPVMLALPRSLHQRLLARIEVLERRSRFAVLLLFVAIAQVMARLMGWA